MSIRAHPLGDGSSRQPKEHQLKVDLSKPVQTRDGRPARVVSEKGIGAFPVLAVVVAEDGSEHMGRFTPAGNVMLAPGQSVDDLVNVPEESVEYRTIRMKPGGDLHVGAVRAHTVEAAQSLKVPSSLGWVWDGIVKITTVEDHIVHMEFLDA